MKILYKGVELTKDNSKDFREELCENYDLKLEVCFCVSQMMGFTHTSDHSNFNGETMKTLSDIYGNDIKFVEVVFPKEDSSLVETVKIGIYDFEFYKKHDLHYDPDEIASKRAYFRKLGLDKKYFSDYCLNGIIDAFSNSNGELSIGCLNKFFNSLYREKLEAFYFNDYGRILTITKIKDSNMYE